MDEVARTYSVKNKSYCHSLNSKLEIFNISSRYLFKHILCYPKHTTYIISRLILYYYIYDFSFRLFQRACQKADRTNENCQAVTKDQPAKRAAQALTLQQILSYQPMDIH